MAQLTPRFSANRAVRDYIEDYYLPAAINFRERSSEKGIQGEYIVSWKETLDRDWEKIRFNEARWSLKASSHEVEVQVYLNGIDPDFVRVEVFSNSIKGDSKPFIQELKLERQLPGEANFYLYKTTVPAEISEDISTLRIIPYFAGVAVPLEEGHILWQK